MNKSVFFALVISATLSAAIAQAAAIRAQVGRPLVLAKDSIASRNFAASGAKIKEAEATLNKTDDELRAIQQMRAYLAALKVGNGKAPTSRP